VGIGKVLSPPLDRGVRESINSTLGLVRRTHSLPPIRGPLEIWAYTDSSEEEEEEGNEIKELREQLATLKLKLNNMDERVAESEIECMDLDDKVDTLCKAVCSKIKRLVKAIGNEDPYRVPDPRV
jgi:predicted nuclease with TOPRIM domain